MDSGSSVPYIETQTLIILVLGLKEDGCKVRIIALQACWESAVRVLERICLACLARTPTLAFSEIAQASIAARDHSTLCRGCLTVRRGKIWELLESAD